MSNNLRLSGKVALVTGAASGIGLATVKLFVAQGAKVVAADRQPMPETFENVVAVQADISIDADAKKMTDTAIAHFGQLDIVFCNAGSGGDSYYFWEYPEAYFDKVIDINLKGVWLTMKYATIAMLEAQKGGSIIITSSVAGLSGMPKGIAYSASKHAVVGIAKTAALELAKHQIRVNTIHPGPIETPMVRGLESLISPKDIEKGKEYLEKSIPMRRYGTAEEVAQLALFLASDDSRYITGSEHRIDGGLRSV